MLWQTKGSMQLAGNEPDDVILEALLQGLQAVSQLGVTSLIVEMCNPLLLRQVSSSQLALCKGILS